VRSISGNLLNRLKYNISGDTLTLSEFQPEEKRMVSISVFVPEAVLKGMTVNDSRANVKGLKQELLYISQNAGQIFMSDNKIDKVHLEVSSKSYLHITATSLDTLSTKIDNSQVIISSPVGVLKGSMENHSSLQMNRIDEIQFKKDESSRLHLNQ
jgi:hypothetical protein